jgi:DNA-binding Lrp family transcriptional regulator
MDKMHLDSADRKLLSLLQVEFPLSREPYADLGLRLGVDRDEVIRRIKQLREMGIIRQISPVLDARRLGYQPTLVAMRVEEAELERAEQLIVDHPGISHGYERDHYFNLWFTLATPAEANTESELERLTGSIGAEATFTLSAVKVFKIGAYFAIDGEEQAAVGTLAKSGKAPSEEVKLSRTDRLIINELQQDLPLIHTPFSAMAARLGTDENQFLAQCQSLKQRSIMRRFGAAVNHRRAGFKANGMTCWIASQEKVDAAGRMLGQLKEVSHCYERKTNPLWPYNLFAMMHGYTKEACQEIAGKVSAETGLGDYVMLFSTRELKKTRVKYLV